MTNRIGALMVIGVVTLPLIANGQGDTRTLTGHVRMTTSKGGRTAAVLVKKDAAAKDVDALFCLDLAAPAAGKLEFTGPARVVYRPQPVTGLPPGVNISGPENISPALAVAPVQGKGWVFAAKGQKPLLGASDPAAAGAATVDVTIVRRLDWAPNNGTRRGTDLEGCLAPGG